MAGHRKYRHITGINCSTQVRSVPCARLYPFEEKSSGIIDGLNEVGEGSGWDLLKCGVKGGLSKIGMLLDIGTHKGQTGMFRIPGSRADRQVTTQTEIVGQEGHQGKQAQQQGGRAGNR